MDVVEITLRGRIQPDDGSLELIEIEQCPPSLSAQQLLWLVEAAVRAIAAKEAGSRQQRPSRCALYHLPCPACGALYTEDECPVCEARMARGSLTALGVRRQNHCRELMGQ